MRPPASRHDAALLRDFLLVTGDLPREKVAGIAQVSPATLRRWECTGPRFLHRKQRMLLLRYLAVRAVYPDRTEEGRSHPA